MKTRAKRHGERAGPRSTRAAPSLPREDPRPDRTASALPRRLSSLLTARDANARDRAWTEFLDEYSRLILRTAQRASSGYDEAMDRYAFILDELRAGDCRRLRAFAADGRGEFTTWLVVVTRRLCVDHHRKRYGRPQSDRAAGSAHAEEHVARRRLVDLVAAEFDVDRLHDQRSPSPEREAVDADSRRLLNEAVAQLPVSDQLLLTLRFEDGLPVEKIATLIGAASRFQVHRRLRRVLAELMATLEAKGISGP